MNSVLKTLRAVEARILAFTGACYGLLPGMVVDGLLIAGALIIAIVTASLAWVVILGVAVIYCLGFYAYHFSTRSKLVGRKGHVVRTSTQTKRRVVGALKKQGIQSECVVLGGVPTLIADLEQGLLVAGQIGSGKTVTILSVLNQILPTLAISNSRALILDPTGAYLQSLAGLGLSSPMFITNPFDARATPINLAAAVNDAVAATSLGDYLIPKLERSTQPFFDDSARAIAAATLREFVRRAPRRWKLRHAVLALRDPALIERLIKGSPEEAVLARYWAANDGTYNNVLASLATHMNALAPAAAAWDAAKRQVDLTRDWIDGPPATLVMTMFELYRSEILRVNQLVTHLVKQRLLSQPITKSLRTTFVALDELGEAGNLELESYLVRGRNYKTVLIAGFQDIAAIRKNFRDGDTFLNQFGTRAILKLQSGEMAEWASKNIGDGAPSFDDVQAGKEKRPAVPPQHWLSMPPADLSPGGVGLHGVYASPRGGVWLHQATPQEVLQALPPQDESVPPFVARPAAELILRPWDGDDDDLFGLTPAPAPAPPSNPKPPQRRVRL